MSRIPITYRDFYDVPRIFLARHGNQLYLFDCPFDEGLDDYPSHYEVYAMPTLSEQELAGSWEELSQKARTHLGHVSVNAVDFDETKRHDIDGTIIDCVLTRQGPDEL